MPEPSSPLEVSEHEKETPTTGNWQMERKEQHVCLTACLNALPPWTGIRCSRRWTSRGMPPSRLFWTVGNAGKSSARTRMKRFFGAPSIWPGTGSVQENTSTTKRPCQQLREGFYPELAKTANRWRERLGQDAVYPAGLPDFLDRCHEQGQLRPTPLILKYEAGGYNCLHQDLYGDVFFPFQVVFALNRCEEDYTGGEFLLVEQRPRAQSRGHVLNLEQGAGLIFPTNHRPVLGSRGYYKTTLRHGVSTIISGTRYSLGIIFHDAK